jgi:hypothetical protein
MRRSSLPVLLSFIASLVLAAPASARTGCDAPPGTAATDQYCETLPTAEGLTDATGKRSRPLATVLPKALVKRLERAGLLGEVLLALPALPRDAAGRPTDPAARAAAADPRLQQLLSGPAPAPAEVLEATGNAVTGVGDQGFAWTLALSLFALAGVSTLRSLRGWSAR